MHISALELSQLLGGVVDGKPDVKVNRPSKIEEGSQGTITFLANMKYEEYLYDTQASIVLVPKDFKAKKPVQATMIRVEDVYACVALLLNKFGEKVKTPATISDRAVVEDGAVLEEEVSLGHFSVVSKGTTIGKGTEISSQVFIGENVQIGENVILYAGVKVYKDCIIGNNVIVHANTVIGSDGFGFAPLADGSFEKIPQLGNVIVEDDVEIGSNTVIDRATMGTTVIKKGAKLDNLIQIAHNVEVGSNTVIAAQTGIAGSTKIGAQCMIGGQVGFVGHIQIADRTKVQAQSGINKSIKKEDTAVYGTPALPYNDFLRAYAVFRRLPDLQKKLITLEKQIKNSET